ncbi:MAG: NAD-binding protein [candidate division Zixibacteria bacterium]|nr:NAD-binding protein [candidate division Zixibacteria bacterium]
MALQSVYVIGGGVMGCGIAETIASHGVEVYLIDKTTRLAEKGIKRISENIDREIERWGLTKSDKKAILSRIHPTSDLALVSEAEMVIEAIPDRLDPKQELFDELDRLSPPSTILVTNTSTLSISEIASVTRRPEKIIGMHFLNPVTKVQIVEVVRGLKTSDETYEFIREFAELINKKPILVHEYPGYVTTRIIVPLLNEAMHVLMEGISTPEDIDNAMKLGFGFNVGPLALADMMGLDEVMAWMENLIGELSDHKYNPCPLLRKMVRAGHLGVKTGEGFFKYDAEGHRLKSNGDTETEAVS